MKTKGLSHLDEKGRARMVDVSSKPDTERIAIAQAEVILKSETLKLVQEGLLEKGDVLAIAQIAGILSAKHTAELIPLCHMIPIYKVDVDLEIDENLPGLIITSRVLTVGKTGAEMEALMAVSVAALTVYDMVKSVEKNAQIRNIHLVEKHGGQSGDVFNL